MSVPSGRLQFFTLEASDYLERLGLIIGRPTAPEPEELVRLTRALRGAALMAGLSPFAEAAQSVEYVAKSLRDGQATWTADQAEILAQAVDELRRLVAQAATWSDQDTAAAEILASELSGGRPRESPSRPAPPGPDDELQPSVRAFVGREGASIAGTLEHAAQAVELGQPGATAEVVLQRLQPLRGLASLPRLSPLPEFLDAIELTVRGIRDGAAPPDAALALRRVAQAVTRLAREIVDTGKATPDAPEVVSGAQLLLAAFTNDDDIVEIATLFAPGDASPIVSQGEASEAPQADPQIELVSLADRFRQAADQLEIAPGPTARTLSLYSLASQLGSLTRSTRPERSQLAEVLATVREAIRNGSAERGPAAFAATLRATAEQLAQSSAGRNAIVFGEDFDQLVATFKGLAGPPPPPRPESIPDDEGDVVPIADLLATEPDGSEPTAFERSFSTYHRLLVADRQPPRPEPVLPPPTEPPAAPVADFDVVAIDSLLYRGRRALERADVVRRDLSVALKARRPFPEVEPLVSELIDLVPLALAE